tara:strand:- start:572 stop:1570 length:999 start_codon:yes stop_codon:yes gene_type:complete
MKLLVTTGFGNIIQGGADIWVNNFIELVLPKLRESFVIFVDGKRPPGFIPNYQHFHFHEENILTSERLLKQSDEIIFLHANYHHRPHLWQHKDKWSTIFVHAYLPDMLDYNDSIRQFNTKVDDKSVNFLLKNCKRRIWIGLNNKSKLFTDFPDKTKVLSNFYEFKHNLPLCSKNTKIGYTARIESRKNIHYLDNHQSFVLSNPYDWKNITENSNFNFSKCKFFRWDTKIHDMFMKKDWFISHSCHTKEPFGYSIFQSIDYGKLPIIHSDWGDVDYKYRASNKKEFDDIVNQIEKDSFEELTHNFNILKEYMLKFSSKERWTKRIKTNFEITI